MPFIKVNTNIALSEEKKNQMKEEFGQAISIFPGKSEAWLMVEIEDEKEMWFRGDSKQKTAMLQVSLFGKTTDDVYHNMTKKLCNIMEQTSGITPDQVYIQYQEVEHWGWNSKNF